VANSGQHPLHLVLAALVQGELDSRRGKPPRLRRRGSAIVEVKALAEPLEFVIGRLALDLGLVDLLDAVAGVRQPLREWPVVGQKQDAGRVRVEPPDGNDACRVVDERDDGRPALRVANGGDDPRGLVQEHVGERLRLDVLAVDLDVVAGRDEGVQLARLTVDGHPPGLDQLVGAAARGDTGTCEVGIESHTRHYSEVVPHYVTLMRWTSQGVAGLPAWRERIEEGERVIEAAGGKLIGVYVTLGRYDVVEIFEAPDDDLAAEIVLKLQRHGAEHTETLRAFTRQEAEDIIRRL
jgi:uncharacterized protein with GYD domain